MGMIWRDKIINRPCSCFRCPNYTSYGTWCQSCFVANRDGKVHEHDRELFEATR